MNYQMLISLFFFFLNKQGQTLVVGLDHREQRWSEILVSDIRAPESEGSLSTTTPILGLKKDQGWGQLKEKHKP